MKYYLFHAKLFIHKYRLTLIEIYDIIVIIFFNNQQRNVKYEDSYC